MSARKACCSHVLKRPVQQHLIHAFFTLHDLYNLFFGIQQLFSTFFPTGWNQATLSLFPRDRISKTYVSGVEGK